MSGVPERPEPMASSRAVPPDAAPRGTAGPSTLTMATYRNALRDATPVMVGYVTLGTAAGILLSAAGLAWWWAPVWSLVIYSGTMQFLLVPLVASGTPLAAIALSTLFVSGRHVFYGLSFPLDRVRRGPERLYAIHAVTDEVYALLASRDRFAMTSRYVLGVEVASQTSWIAGTTAGALLGTALGSVLGDRVQLAGFVLTALFVVLALENWDAAPDRSVLVLGLVAASVGLVVPGTASLLAALSILTGGLACLFVLRSRQPGGRGAVTGAPAARGEGS